MPFKVLFENPGIYLAGHPKEREVTELIVNAPDENGALFHAIRVVSGDIGHCTVVPYDKLSPLPPVEAFNDIVEHAGDSRA